MTTIFRFDLRPSWVKTLIFLIERKQRYPCGPCSETKQTLWNQNMLTLTDTSGQKIGKYICKREMNTSRQRNLSANLKNRWRSIDIQRKMSLPSSYEVTSIVNPWFKKSLTSRLETCLINTKLRGSLSLKKKRKKRLTVGVISFKNKKIHHISMCSLQDFKSFFKGFLAVSSTASICDKKHSSSKQKKIWGSATKTNEFV